MRIPTPAEAAPHLFGKTARGPIVDPRMVHEIPTVDIRGKSAQGLGLTILAVLLVSAGVAAGAVLYVEHKIKAALTLSGIQAVPPGQAPIGAGWSTCDPQLALPALVSVLGPVDGPKFLQLATKSGWTYACPAPASNGP